MNTALCTLDNVVYDATDFMLTVNFANNRRHLVCTVCGTRAFFRRQGRNDREACFYSKHAAGCNRATLTHPTTHAPENAVERRRIVVNFNYGPQTTTVDRQPTGGVAADAIHENQNNGNVRRNHSTRNMRSLLSELIGNDGFTSSEIMIEIPGRGEYAIADLFVNFASVTADHIGRYCGFWGRIVNADTDTRGSSLYFNSGNMEAVSVVLDEQFHVETANRYGTDNLNDFRGAYMLVFGELSVSRRGKKYIQITDQNSFTLRLH